MKKADLTAHIVRTIADEASALETRAMEAYDAGDIATYLALRKASLALESRSMFFAEDYQGQDKAHATFTKHIGS